MFPNSLKESISIDMKNEVKWYEVINERLQTTQRYICQTTKEFFPRIYPKILVLVFSLPLDLWTN